MMQYRKDVPKLLLLAFMLQLLFFQAFTPLYVNAATLNPTASSNLSVGLRKCSYLTKTNDGYMRVFVTSKNDKGDGYIHIEYYDKGFNVLSKNKIKRELIYWGGFFAGKNYYFTVEGQANTAESDTAEVVRVNKYDKNWKKLGTAKITGNSDMFGGEVRYPFDYGCCEMTEMNGILYIATGHEGYVDPAYNQGHQGMLLLMVDEAAMTGEIADCDLWHSFAQYIDSDESALYLLENSEGSARSQVTVYDPSTLPIDYFSAPGSREVLKYGGERTSAWAVATYATVDDIALSKDNILSLGTSIDQEKYGSDYTYNVYIGVTPKDSTSTEATTIKWLTSHKDDDNYFTGAMLTKINDNRFLVSWQENDETVTGSISDPLSSKVLHYVFIDANGNKLTNEFTAKATISDCAPIYDGTNICFYASSGSCVNFYMINGQTGKFTQKTNKVIGDNATWEVSNNTLTINGTGALTMTDNSAWNSIQSSINRIVINSGITSIPDNAFNYFSNLKEIYVKEGVEKIGAEAFAYNNDKFELYLPSTVTNIGKDLTWTGYYWMGSGSLVMGGTIYAPEGSYAQTYAKKNGISYKSFDGRLSKAAITFDKKSYVYTGRIIKPKIKVVLDNNTLKEGTDYTISYASADSKNVGKYKIKITAKGNKYSGSKTITYEIVPKAVSISIVKPGKKSFTAKWTKQTKQTTGYELQYSTNKKFTSAKTIPVKNNKKVTATKKNLKSGKKYYLRIRTYRNVKYNGKTIKVYSSWSKVKTVKTK